MKIAKFLLILLILVSATVGTVILLSSKPNSSQTGDRINIVASANFWGDVAKQIGGDRVNVTSVISDPEADPHLYESSASNAAALAEADIVIVNGLGFDDFMDKLLGAAPADKRTVIRADEATNTAKDANPHIWYDPAKVQLVAKIIEAELVRLDSTHAEEYRQNLQKFTDENDKITAAAARIAQAHPGAPVAYTERVSEYILVKAGLTIKTPEGFSAALEEGNDASPADAVAMQDLIAKGQVKVFVYNPQAASPTTERLRELARSAGVPVVAMTETLPTEQPSIQAWQLSQVESLESALNGN